MFVWAKLLIKITQITTFLFLSCISFRFSHSTEALLEASFDLFWCCCFYLLMLSANSFKPERAYRTDTESTSRAESLTSQVRLLLLLFAGRHHYALFLLAVEVNWQPAAINRWATMRWLICAAENFQVNMLTFAHVNVFILALILIVGAKQAEDRIRINLCAACCNRRWCQVAVLVVVVSSWRANE